LEELKNIDNAKNLNYNYFMKWDKNVIEWLLEDNNPAIAYRTQTEILGQTGDKKPVIKWLLNFFPIDWKEKRFIMFVYYLTAFAECGLDYTDIQIDKSKVIKFYKDTFRNVCGDFMHLRALSRLGLVNEPTIVDFIHRLPEGQLSDGGFLCSTHLEKIKNRVPKSCVKDNMYALMAFAECKKKGIKISNENRLINYFWNHNLFYRTDNPETLMLNVREGWRTIDTFYPFEAMRIGIQNIIESFCVLGYGKDEKLKEAWNILENKKDKDGKYILEGTLSKSYLPKEKIGKPSKWVTFYTLLAKKYMI